MFRYISAISALLFSMACFSMPTGCPSAAATNTLEFCHSFKQAAECYCTSAGVPRGMCNNMSQLYNRMISMYGSVQRACEYQRHTSVQLCLDDWNCYRNGGKNSQNQLCNATGQACE